MPSFDANVLKQRTQQLIGGFTASQKVIVVLALVAMLGGGYAFTKWVSAPTMTPLFSSLSSDDASAMTTELDKKGVKYSLTNGGATILVPQSQVYQLRLDMAGAGLTASDTQGYKLLDNSSSITQSDFQTHVQYQRALEGELDKTIGSIDGVKSANVHLVIPQTDVFSDDSVKPTASVLINTGTGGTISSGAVKSIVNLVATSVEGLSTDSVTVADSNGKLLSANGAGTGTEDQNNQTAATENDLNAKIQALLTPLVGEGKAVVRTTAELNWDQSKTTSEQWNPTNKTPAVASETIQTEGLGAGAAGGSAATGCIGTETPVNGVCQTSQTQASAGTTGTTAAPYSNQNITRDYAQDHQITETQVAVGAPKRITVAVVLDSTTAKNIDTTKITDLVTQAAGLQPARGDAVTVTPMPFDTSATSATDAAAKAGDKAASSAAMMNYIKIGVTVLIILAVLGLLFMTTKRRAKLYKSSDISMAELNSAMPSFDNPDALLDSLESSVVIDTSPEALERQKVDREITDLIEKQPEEVATLLRGWLADRRS